MDSKQQQVAEVIAKILKSDQEILNSEITVLSDLNDDDLLNSEQPGEELITRKD